MAWYTNPENTQTVTESLEKISGTVTNKQAEEIFESVTLNPDQIHSFAKKFGLDVTKDDDGTFVAIPSDNFKDANFSSQFLDFWIGNTSEKLALEQKRQVRNNSYKLMDDILGEATLALDMYSDEGLGVGFIEQPIDIEINGDEQVQKDVMEILKRNEFIKHSRSHLRSLVKWGDLGVQLVLPDKSTEATEIKLKTHTPDCWKAFSPDNCKVSVGYSLQSSSAKKKTSISINNRINKESILQPWEFVQFSVFDSEFCPYGRGLLEGMRTSFDQLVTIEALLAMSRATRVEKLIVKIPTGQTNPTAAFSRLNQLKSTFKNSIFSNSGTGRKSYAKNPAMQDTLFIPSDEGFDIEKMAAGSGVEISNTDDVEYFRDKLLMVTGIPKGILLADESTDRYHALAQQDLKFARKLIPFQDSYAAGLTKLCMLLVGYVGGDINNTNITVKLKRPVQVSDQVLQSYEAISRAAIEMIDAFKRSQETNEGDQPEIKPDTYSRLLSQLGMPEDIVKLLNNSILDDPENPSNSTDDDNISTITASKCSSDEILLADRDLFNIFTSGDTGNLLLEVLQLEDKRKIRPLEVIKTSNIPKSYLKEYKNVKTNGSRT